jgi:DNA-binding NarL/FixJ family response regulator
VPLDVIQSEATEPAEIKENAPLVADDEWEPLLSSMSKRRRAVVEGLRNGESVARLAARLRISVKTLRRIAERCREQLAER